MDLHILPCDPRVDAKTSNAVTAMLNEFLDNKDFQYIYNWKINHDTTDHYYHERFNENYDFMSLFEGAWYLISYVTLYTKEYQDCLKPYGRYYYIYISSADWLYNSFSKRKAVYLKMLHIHRRTLEFFEEHCDINENRAISEGNSRRIAEGMTQLANFCYSA